MSGWDDAENAALYDAFVRTHPFYTNASIDLVELAGLRDARTVVDLACGTGATTRVLLGRIGPGARVVAIDASGAMLAQAQSGIADARVAWIRADAHDAAGHVTGADVIVCSAALWQTDMQRTLRACAAALRDGGRLAFNLPRQFLRGSAAPRPLPPTLLQLTRMVAVADYGFVAPARGMALLSLASIRRMLSGAGLALDRIVESQYPNSARADLDWCCIPVFSEEILPGLPRAQQLEAIRSASRQTGRWVVRQNRWLTFVTRKHESAPAASGG